MGQTTITVQDETLERFNQLKEDANTREEPSSDRFLTLLMNGWEHGTKEDEGGIPDGLEAIANGDVDVGTDEIESSLETIEERTGRIERTLEELQR